MIDYQARVPNYGGRRILVVYAYRTMTHWDTLVSRCSKAPEKVASPIVAHWSSAGHVSTHDY